MKSKKRGNFFSKLPLWFKIISSIVIVILFLTGLFVYAFLSMIAEDRKAEKIIDQKFHQEVSQIPQLKIKSFQLWDGDSMVRAEIENKGEVFFWYGLDGVPRLEVVGPYSTLYPCFYIDGNAKIRSNTSQPLVLGNNSQFTKWFPFEVNSLRNLVEKYDEIIAALKTFPTNTKTEMFQSNYTLKQQLNGKELWCDLYTRPPHIEFVD